MRFTNAVASGAKETARGKLAAVGREHGNNQPRFRAGISKIVQKKNATMRQLITMDQSADVAVLADEDTFFRRGFGEQGSVSGIRCPLSGIDHIMAGVA